MNRRVGMAVWKAGCIILLAMCGQAAATAQTLDVWPREAELRGAGNTLQFVASAIEGGYRRDVTELASYANAAPDIVQVATDGRVTAVADGRAEILVRYAEQEIQVVVHVRDCGKPPEPDFSTDVQPILATLGCSTGACHGKQGGQNGFQLSLLGFDDNFDYAAITQEGRGRRVFFASPENSLLLRKAAAVTPHGGGRRMEVGDAYYQTLLRWLEAGAPRQGERPLQLESLEIHPRQLVMTANSRHRLAVIGRFSDGSQRDVTALTALSSNEAVVAKPGANGVVGAGPIAGEAAIMGRYLGAIATCDVLIPAASAIDDAAYDALPRRNEIDDLVWAKLKRLRILPSAPADDQRLVRRLYLDLIGQTPSPEEVIAYLDDSRPDKRQRLIDSLLEHPAYADHWANKWVDLLRPNPYRVGIKAVLNFDDWIRQNFRENRPYDTFVRDLLTAEGSTWRNGAATLFRDRREPEELATIVSQLFLGVRLECAKCHHHPFEVWAQDDFYAFASFFAKVGRKGTGLSPPISGGEEIVFTANRGQVTHPRTGEVMEPRALGAGELDAALANENPRRALAQWLTSDDNPYFAKVIANRLWAEMMGRGVVEPVDDMRATNPPSNPQLLNALADHLRQHHYDLKALLRWIANSHVYGLSSSPNETNVADYQNYSRHYRRRLRAEVLLDAVNAICDAREKLDAMPRDSAANAIWTHRVPSLFLDTFGRPDANQDPPCERTTDTAVVQTLHLMNAPQLHDKIRAKNGRAARLAESELTPAEIVQQLYLRAYARRPTEQELQVALGWFEREDVGRRQAVEDLLWALINSAEFVFED